MTQCRQARDTLARLSIYAYNSLMSSQLSRRITRRLQVRFRPIGEREAYAGYTADISETGMFVSTIRPLKPGTELDVEVRDKHHSLRLDAVVIHARKVPPMWQRIRPSGMGVRFLEPEETAEGLRRLVGRSAVLW